MKLCCTCKSVKENHDFHKSSFTTDGLGISCKDCRKKADAKCYKSSSKRGAAIKTAREKIIKYNKSLTTRYKRFCGCLVCGEKEPVCLDLHHLDPTEKEADPSQMVSHSTENLRKEIRKCVVLCSNDHRKYPAGLIKLLLVSVNGKPTLL